MAFEGIENLYARRGTAAPNLCFAGHTDVVPTGNLESWSADPFEAELRDGVVIGRGAVDMKGGISAWVAAVAGVLAEGERAGSLSLLITGDEEGPALHGTKRVVQALMAEGEVIDACVVGEPSSQQVLGDMIKIGRRGSLNTWITVKGKQGHVAYPDRAANPAPVLARLLTELTDHRLDEGFTAFQPSNLEITTIDVGNVAHNVIPAKASAKFNIRFNTNHTGEQLLAWIEDCRQRAERYGRGATITVDARAGAHPFYTTPGAFTDLVCAAVTDATGRTPKLSTSGGTSDARYIKDYCPVAELGLQNATAHMVDERVRVDDVRALADIYAAVLTRYFAG
jgi:succinyl-diaminopimelate desuccinylase